MWGWVGPHIKHKRKKENTSLEGRIVVLRREKDGDYTIGHTLERNKSEKGQPQLYIDSN